MSDVTRETGFTTCPSCNGRKTLRALIKPVEGDCYPGDIECTTCNGSGQVDEMVLHRRSLGDQLRELRLQDYVTQKVAADRLGVDVVTYSHLERGQHENLDLYETALNAARGGLQ